VVRGQVTEGHWQHNHSIERIYFLFEFDRNWGYLVPFSRHYAYFPKARGHMTVTTPFRGQFVVRRLGLAMFNMHTKFEFSSLSRFHRYLRETNNLKWVTWRVHAHFRDSLSSVYLVLLCSTHTPNLKCLRILATKKWKATPNVKILIMSLLGDLGVHRVHLWLNGKHILDFLLAIIELLC